MENKRGRALASIREKALNRGKKTLDKQDYKKYLDEKFEIDEKIDSIVDKRSDEQKELDAEKRYKEERRKRGLR